MPLPFQDTWKCDTLANYQSPDPQSVYSGSWYDSIKNGRDAGCQLLGGTRYSSIQNCTDSEHHFSGGLGYSPIQTGTNNESQLSNAARYPYLSQSSAALSNVSNGFSYNNPFPESFEYNQSYQIPGAASQEHGIRSSGRYVASELAKNLSKPSNGHFQEFDRSILPSTYGWSSLQDPEF